MRTTLAALSLFLSAPALATDVLILETGGDAILSGYLTTLLASSGQFTTIDVWRGDLAAPDVTDLQPYNAVITFSNTGWFDATVTGDALYDFVNLGGGVVLTNFEWSFPLLTGRILNLAPLTSPSQNGYAGTDLLGATLPHPITAGVNTLVDPFFHSPDAIPANGGTLVASYDSGAALAAFLDTGAGKVVALNLVPFDDNVPSPYGPGQGLFFDPASDGVRLVNNALGFVAGATAPTFTTAALGSCGGPVTISTVGATPSGNLAYVTGTAGGSSIVPAGPCAGTSLPIGSPRLRASRTATAGGTDTINVPTLGPALCGDTYLVLDSATCTIALSTLPL